MPPPYNLSQVVAPVVLYTSNGDHTAAAEVFFLMVYTGVFAGVIHNEPLEKNMKPLATLFIKGQLILGERAIYSI